MDRKTAGAVLILACVLSAGCDNSQPSLSQVPTHQADAAGFSIVNVFDLGRREVRNFVFTPGTRRLYVSFTDREDDLLYEWDVDREKLLRKYRLGKGYMCDSLAASPDGRYLIVGCWPLDFPRLECKTVILDTEQKRITTTLDLMDRTFSPKFRDDGKRFWVDDREHAFDLAGRPLPQSKFREPEPTRGSPWRIESSKMTVYTHGLYYRDASGKDHLLTQAEWHDNYCITKDGKFVASTTWGGEIVVWRTSDCHEVYRKKIADQYGYLAYDAEKNRILLGDATYNGTRNLRALTMPSAANEENDGQPAHAAGR